MKNIPLYTVLTLVAVGFVSCGKTDSSNNGNFPSDGIVRISTTVSVPETRAAVEPYEGSDLGLFLDYGDGDRYSQNNVRWTRSGTDWAPDETMLWKDASTRLKGVYAYAPYVAGEDNPAEVKFTIPLDQSQGLDAADLLWCPMQGFDPATGLTDGKVNVEFKHALVKLTVNIILSTEFKGKDISIREALFRKSVDRAAIYFRGNSGTPESFVDLASDVSANAVSLKMRDCSADGKLACEVIFYPHGFFAGNEMLTITLSDGKDYRLTPGKNIDFTLGSAYQMNVKVGNDKIEIGSVTIAEWGGTKTVGGDDAGFDAVKSSVPVNISDLRTQLSEWNTANPSAQKSLADLITPELLDKSLSGDGSLVVTGEFDNSGAAVYVGMSEETVSALARIAEDVRSGKVTKLDLSGLKGIKGLSRADDSGWETCDKDCSFKGSKLETFIGSPDIVALNGTFWGCDQLTSVSGLENVTTVRSGTFYGCSKLASVPDMPLVTSLIDVFAESGITELRHKNVKELWFGGNYPELKVIDCPSANVLKGIWRMPKLEELRLTSEYFDMVDNSIFDEWYYSDKQKVTIYLNANRHVGDETSYYDWWPAKNGDGEPCDDYDYENPIKLDGFKAIYCGDDKIK